MKKKSTVRMVNETIQEGIQSTRTENSYHDTLQTLTRRLSELETCSRRDNILSPFLSLVYC
jgi:hypothetical protein